VGYCFGVNVLALLGHSDQVQTMAISPDGCIPGKPCVTKLLREVGIGVQVNAFRSCVDTGEVWTSCLLVLMVIPLLVAVVTPHSRAVGYSQRSKNLAGT